MNVSTIYHLGGYIPAAPAQNRAQEFDLVAGTFTSWDPAGTVLEQRVLTAAEIARNTPSVVDVNKSTLQQRATDSIAANNTYLAIATPTNAQVAAQVRFLTRESSAVIRLLLNQFDAVDT